MGVETGILLNLCGSLMINGGQNLMKLSHNIKNEELEKSKSEQNLQELQNTISDTTSIGDSNQNMNTQLANSTPSTEELNDLSPKYANVTVGENKLLATASSSVSETTHGNTPINNVERNSSEQVSSKDKKTSIKEYLLGKIWLIGTVFFVVGSLINFTSFGFAPQSLLAAMGSAQFVSNVAFSKFVLGEKITRRAVTGTCIIVIGNVFAIVFSASESKQYDAEALWMLYDGGMKIYMAFLCFLVAILYLTYKFIRNEKKKGIDVKFGGVIAPVCYAASSAVVGTWSVLMGKCLSELLRRTLSGQNQLTHFFTYVCLCAWLLATVFWLYRMNRALSKFDGLFIIPVLQVFWTFFSIITGGIYFKEFDSFDGLQYSMFFTGVALVFIGVALLSPTKKSDDDILEESYTDMEMDESEQISVSNNSTASSAHRSTTSSIVRPNRMSTTGGPHGSRYSMGGVPVRAQSRVFSISSMPMLIDERSIVSVVDTVTSDTYRRTSLAAINNLNNPVGIAKIFEESNDYNCNDEEQPEIKNPTTELEGSTL